MSDPLSITASVAGLVSLGFQVVSGITKYLDAVRERKDDVTSAKAHVFRMQELLKRVEIVAAKVEPTHGTTAAFLKDFALVQPELQALEKFVRSLDVTKVFSPNHEMLGKVYVQAKKLTYPFHRPTMDRLQSGLLRMNDMLQAAVQVSGVDIVIDTDCTVSAIKSALPDMAQRLSKEIKQGSVANRDAVTRVGDTVMSLSDRFDQGFKVLEGIASTSSESMSGLHRDHADHSERLLQELSVTRNGVSDLSDTVRDIDQGIVNLREAIATTGDTYVSLLRKDYTENQAMVLQELTMTRNGVCDLSDTFKDFQLALRALSRQEDLGRLISKPAQLKEVCGIVEAMPYFTTVQNSSNRLRINLARRTCVCRRRVIRSRQVRLWGPWQASADTSTTHDHFPDCQYHLQGTEASSKRWAVVFKGLWGLAEHAIEVSFSYSFGAGGCSLSPGFNYYPTIDSRRDPAFRIMGLFRDAALYYMHKEDIGEFWEQCLENMALLYRHGKASPKAVDLHGRGILHYFKSYFMRFTDPYPSLMGLDTLIKHGVQTTMYDIYGSYANLSHSNQIVSSTDVFAPRHRTPAWTATCQIIFPGDMDDGTTFEGPGSPLNWESCSLLSDFLCAQEPDETIVTKSVLEFPYGPSQQSTLELFGLIRLSQNTAKAFGCGPLSLAALEGDLMKMDFVLTNYPNAINELNLLKQTPLHLAVGHASCVAFLLNGSGRKLIDLPDSGGRVPLEYALFFCLCAGKGGGDDHCYHGCSKNDGDNSLDILLDADCMIPKISSWPCDRYFSGSLLICDNCLRAVSAHLVDRSQRLKMLATNNLPRIQATLLRLFSPCLLDSKATVAIQVLNDRGISVPSSLQVHGSGGEKGCDDLSSAYHSRGPFSFPFLSTLGFRDLDTPDNDGLTPLMLLCSQDWRSFGTADAGRCAWLIENGADLWNLAPDGVSTIGHQLYSKIGKTPPQGRWVEDSIERRRHVVDLTEKLSRRDPRDGCRCACSPGGCTPFVRFLQTARSERNINSLSEFAKQLPRIMTETHASVSRVQMRSAIRYATFWMLGIRHTCCHDNRIALTFARNKDEAELDELRQEDRFLVALLDDLATEFAWELEQMSQERYVNKRVSFWHGYWLPRMQQVLKSIGKSELEESDKVAAENIGVVWYNQKSGEDKCCDPDSDSDSNNGSDDDSDRDYDRNCVSESNSATESESDGGSEGGGYHESDWDSDTDEYDMIQTFRTPDDWTSRLDLIMAKAGLSVRL